MDNNDLQNEIATLKQDLGRLRTDFADIANSMLEAGRAEAGDARERVESELKDRLDQMRSAADRAADRGRQAKHSVEHTIEERPLMSVVVAFGVGLLAGKIFGDK